MSCCRRPIEELPGGEGQKKIAVLDAAKPYLLACLHRDLRLPTLVITTGPDRAKQLYDELLSWCAHPASIQLFPEPDALPYERLTSDLATVQQRLRTLFVLSQGDAVPLILTSAQAIIRKTMSAADFASACHVLKKGMSFDWNQMLARWVDIGYEREGVVEVPGTMSRRGGIIDIYAPNNQLPAWRGYATST